MFKLTSYQIIKLLLLAIVCIAFYQFNYSIYSLRATQSLSSSEAGLHSKSQQPPDKSIQDEFQKIYKHFIWGPGGGGSGEGSTVNYTTMTRSIISNVIRNYSIKSMLDAPCGAMVSINYGMNFQFLFFL